MLNLFLYIDDMTLDLNTIFNAIKNNKVLFLKSIIISFLISILIFFIIPKKIFIIN